MSEEVKNWYFTFGGGQEHNGRFVKISGTMQETRLLMHKKFRMDWSMQYPEIDENGKKFSDIAKRWNWVELELEDN